jgi:PQQ-like domain
VTLTPMLERKPRTALGPLLAGVALALTLAAGSASNADSRQMPPRAGQASLPSTVSGRYAITGYVNAMTRAAGAVYVGGEFARIANRTGSAVVVPTRGGRIEPGRAEVAGGPVDAAIADGKGGWYLGGTFTTVGDSRRNGLAHVDADGRLDRGFAPSSLGEVKALALAGEILVVSAGAPKTIAVTHALDARTGAALPITYVRPRRAGAARTLLVSGERLYIGFGNRRLAAYSVTTGARLWDRQFCESCYQDPGGVRTMAIDHERLIVGGGFKVGRNENLAVLVAATGELRGPSLRIPNSVGSIALVKGTLYVAFERYHPGSSGLDAVNLATGHTRAWAAIRPGQLVADDTTLYMTGIRARDEHRSFLLERVYSARAGTAHAVLHTVSPPLSASVLTLAPQRGQLLIGGSFTGAGGAVRHNLAAFDSHTGKLLPWNPDASDAGCCGVKALAANGRTIYVGGPFKSVSGVPRTGLAAISADGRGRVLPWHPRLGYWSIDALAVGAGRVFVGGFLSFPGNPRKSTSLVAFSTRGAGAHLAFSPKLGFEFDVSALTAWHRTLIVGGQSVIAYSAVGNGRRELWRRSADSVFTFLTRGKTLYVGGSFDRVGRRPRKNLAALALDRRGAVLGFAPAVPISVETLARLGSDIVFGGGDFDGESTQVLGAVTADGTLEPWRFDATPQSIEVTRIAPIQGGLFAVGHFDWLGPPGKQAASGLAWLH